MQLAPSKSSLDLTWLARLHALASYGHRVVYGFALAMLVALYVFMAIPTGYDVQPIWLATEPLYLAALLAGWRAVGHPLRATGWLAIALLALNALFFADIAMRLPSSREALLAFSRNFPDPRWHNALSAIGADGPYYVLASLFYAVLLVLTSALIASLVLRFWRVGGTDSALAGLGARVRSEVAKSGDAPSMLLLIDRSRWKGWAAGTLAAAVLLTPMLLSGRERTIPGADGLAGLLPDTIARIVTFVNDRAWALLLALIVSTVLWRMARWYLMPTAQFALELDQRPPILLLRSFKDDHAAVAPVDLWRRLLHPVLWPVRALLAATGAKGIAVAVRGITRRRIEEVAAQSLRDAGPFIAIGDRGDRAPELGAFRAELPDNVWQDPARRWMREARLIVMVLGTTESVEWELRTIVTEGLLGKLILLMPPVDAVGRAERWRLATDCLADTPWHDHILQTDPRRLLAVCFTEGGHIATMTSSNRSERDFDLAVRIGTGMVVIRGA